MYIIKCPHSIIAHEAATATNLPKDLEGTVPGPVGCRWWQSPASFVSWLWRELAASVDVITYVCARGRHRHKRAPVQKQYMAPCCPLVHQRAPLNASLTKITSKCELGNVLAQTFTFNLESRKLIVGGSVPPYLLGPSGESTPCTCSHKAPFPNFWLYDCS